MIIDAKNWTSLPAKVDDIDIIIVGSGAAGIALAMEFANTDTKVIVLEAGGHNYDQVIQDPYKGDVVTPANHGPLESYRRRMFGGTTTVWGGRCSPFVELDFKERDYVKNSGWPITKDEMDPYYVRAHDYCDVGDFDYSVAGSLNGNPRVIPDLQSEVVVQDEIWRFSHPTNFKEKYQADLETAHNIQLLINAACLSIEADSETGAVKELLIATSLTTRLRLRGKQYVIAAGGLETTRLLLVSNNVFTDGLGNSSGLLGKYYASHITGNFGEVKLTEKNSNVSWKYTKTDDGVYYKQRLRILDKIQKEKKLLNTRVILTHPGFGDPRHGSGVLSGAYLVKRFLKGQIPPEYSKDLASQEYKHVLRHICNVIVDSPRSFVFAYDWISKRIFSRRKLPSIALKSKSGIYTLHYDSEQTHIVESSVGLSDAKDEYGIPRLKVDWQYDENDIENLYSTYKIITDEITASKAGVMLSSDDEVKNSIKRQVGVGSHQLGSTRMSADPNKGVVNESCRVHDVPNLYLASPSVFCTGGFANPLLTIVALSIRIADHLKKVNA